MIVEFVGAAGVGKSYLSDRVLQALQAGGLPARDFTLINKRRAGARSLVLLARAIYLASLMRQNTLSAFSIAAEIIWKYSIRREVGEQLEGIHITSEGLFHKLISFQRRSNGLAMNELADILFQKIEPPDAVVVVEASAEIIFARRVGRNRANDLFSPESVEDDLAMVRESVGAMEHIRRSIHPDMQILRINADEEGGDKTVAVIAAALEQSAGARSAMAVAGG